MASVLNKVQTLIQQCQFLTNDIYNRSYYILGQMFLTCITADIFLFRESYFPNNQELIFEQKRGLLPDLSDIILQDMNIKTSKEFFYMAMGKLFHSKNYEQIHEVLNNIEEFANQFSLFQNTFLSQSKVLDQKSSIMQQNWKQNTFNKQNNKMILNQNVSNLKNHQPLFQKQSSLSNLHEITYNLPNFQFTNKQKLQFVNTLNMIEIENLNRLEVKELLQKKRLNIISSKIPKPNKHKISKQNNNMKNRVNNKMNLNSMSDLDISSICCELQKENVLEQNKQNKMDVQLSIDFLNRRQNMDVEIQSYLNSIECFSTELNYFGQFKLRESKIQEETYQLINRRTWKCRIIFSIKHYQKNYQIQTFSAQGVANQKKTSKEICIRRILEQLYSQNKVLYKEWKDRKIRKCIKC